MQATLRQIQYLERELHHDPDYRAEQQAIQRVAEQRKQLAQFLLLFPKSCRKAVLLQLDNDSGLRQVFYCFQSRRWPLVPIPLEVAQIYLQELNAVPFQRCTQCHLLLPIRWGIWLNTTTQCWWQAPVRYFAACPACGGSIGSREEGKPYNYPYVPLRVEPPWKFQDGLDIPLSQTK